MKNNVLMQVERLTRRYGETRAVDDLNFTLHRGEALGLLGPNGAGKSTTLRILAGVLAPDAGRIVINGIDLLDQPRRAKQAIGYLPEPPPLYPELTVDEQLHYSARLHGLSRAASRQAIVRVKERCGLTEMGRRLTGNLSRGYQQRIGLAQAILHDPPVIILDEPTAGLDPIQLREIRNLICALSREYGVILSTHLLAEVQITCSHVLILRAGRQVYSGALAELDPRQQPGRLLVGMNTPPPVTVLARLPRVTQVDDLGEGRFRLHHAPGALPQRIVVELAYDCGWDLWELTPESVSLEQIFFDLTVSQGDSA